MVKTHHVLVSWDEEPFHIEMHSTERDYLLRILREKNPQSIVEWGSGGSTVLIAENKDKKAKFTSVEHSSIWYNKVGAVITPLNTVNFIHAPANVHTFTRGYKRRRYVSNRWCSAKHYLK